MKPELSSLKTLKRLPLTLAAACLGVGGIGLAVTLHKPVALSPFNPTPASIVAVPEAPAGVIVPEPFNLVLEVPEAPVSETPAEPLFVAAPRPVAPVVQQPPAIQQVPVPSARPALPIAPAPAPDAGPGASAADSGPVIALGPIEKPESIPPAGPDSVGGNTPEPEGPGPTPVPNDPPTDPGTPSPNVPPETRGNGNGKALGLDNGNGPKQSSEKQAHEKPAEAKNESGGASKK